MNKIVLKEPVKVMVENVRGKAAKINKSPSSKSDTSGGLMELHEGKIGVKDYNIPDFSEKLPNQEHHTEKLQRALS